MKNKIIKKELIFSIILITMICTIPISSSTNKNYVTSATTMDEGDNILAYIYVNYSGWQTPEKVVTFYDGEVYEFPEDLDGRVKVNFTVYTYHKLQWETIIPWRWTIVYFTIYNLTGEVAQYQYSKNPFKWKPLAHLCTDTLFQKITHYIDQNQSGIDEGWKFPYIETNGEDFPLHVHLTVGGFPPLSCLIQKNKYKVVDWDIIIRPI